MFACEITVSPRASEHVGTRGHVSPSDIATAFGKVMLLALGIAAALFVVGLLVSGL